MVTAADIKWGSYKDYEGPVFYGKQRYEHPDNPDEASEILSVVTATEGGAYDAYNGYDVCMCTSGLIQWCDRAPYFLVCGLLGYVAEKNRTLLLSLDSLAQKLGYVFKRNPRGLWRYFLGDEEVNTKERQQKLFFAGATGLKGSFSEEQKEHAKEWAAAVSRVWEHPAAQQYQREYTLPKLLRFATPDTVRVMQASRQEDGPYSKALRAAYISFAVNNPKRAAKALMVAVEARGAEFSRGSVIEMLRSLTFQPGVAIYPHRYDKIRPVLEKLYKVDLPDFSEDLEAWSTVNDLGPEKHTPRGLQLALMELTYDVGVRGADGHWGKLSAAALRQFEEDQGLPKRFQDGVPDEHTVPLLRAELEAVGCSFDFRA